MDVSGAQDSTRIHIRRDKAVTTKNTKQSLLAEEDSTVFTDCSDSQDSFGDLMASDVDDDATVNGNDQSDIDSSEGLSPADALQQLLLGNASPFLCSSGLEPNNAVPTSQYQSLLGAMSSNAFVYFFLLFFLASCC